MPWHTVSLFFWVALKLLVFFRPASATFSGGLFSLPTDTATTTHYLCFKLPFVSVAAGLSSETDAGAGVVQRRTRAAEEGSPAGLGGPDGPAAPMALAPPTSWKPDDWTENVLRFGFQLMIVTIDYGLMLISMTFNAVRGGVAPGGAAWWAVAVW